MKRPPLSRKPKFLNENLLVFVLFALTLSHSPRLVEIAKEVNSKKTTWIANEAITTRDYSQFIGVVENTKLPIKHISPLKNLPESFDAAENWPECPSLKEIRDQSVCGSCWAFSTAEAATDRLCIASEGKIQDRLSAQDLLTCCGSCGMGCFGGSPAMAWYYMNAFGVTTGGEYNSTN